MKTAGIASWATAFLALVTALGASAQDATCGKNHYILDYGTAAWTPTGSLNVARSDHTATLLPDGRVLVAGGSAISDRGFVALDSAELYDPATGEWTLTGSMTYARTGHTATLLPNGKVLVVGADWVVGTAELYDPATGSWTLTGRLNAGRTDFTATLLATGKVLVVGGDGVPTAELYDPSTETWSFTGGLSRSHVSHTAALLRDGRVLIVGGTSDLMLDIPTPVVEVYDPTAGIWSRVHDLGHTRASHTATTLQDGKVLVAGGGAVAEVFDPITGAWQDVGDLSVSVSNHTATLLPDGEVLVAGGTGGPTPNVSSTETYDPATATWRITGSLGSARSGHTATLLSDGSVLVAGGGFFDPSRAPHWSPFGTITLSSAELYAAAGTDGCQ